MTEAKDEVDRTKKSTSGGCHHFNPGDQGSTPIWGQQLVVSVLRKGLLFRVYFFIFLFFIANSQNDTYAISPLFP